MKQKYETLLTEATALIERRGYRGVSIQDITEAAGVSIGTFYNHFASKEALYTAIVSRIEADGMRRVEAIVNRYRSPLNKIRVLYRFVTLGVRRNRILRGVLTGERDFMSPGIKRHIQDENDIRHRIEVIIADILREGTMNNVFRTGLYRNATFLVTGLFDTILQNLDSDQLENLVEDLLMLIERGLKRRLRLRRRNERLDRRMLRDSDDEDELFEP